MNNRNSFMVNQHPLAVAIPMEEKTEGSVEASKMFDNKETY